MNANVGGCVTYRSLHPEPKKPVKYGRWILAAALAAGISMSPKESFENINPFSFKKTNVSEKKESVRVPASVPSVYKGCYETLVRFGATQEEIDSVYEVFNIETNHKHYDEKGRVKVGKYKDIGVSQSTPIGVEETIRKTLIEPDSHRDFHAKKVASEAIGFYLRKYMTESERNNFIKSYKARKSAVNKIVNLITKDKYANFYFGAACVMYCRADALDTAEAHDVKFRPEMTGAWYNAPQATRNTIPKGRRWTSKLPSITQNYVKEYMKK